MGLHRFRPPPSGRMGVLWTLGSIRDAVLLEFGCMGHLLYSRVALNRAGIGDACKFYSTHIDETDITFGDTERLRRAVADLVQYEKPRLIFLTPSAVPEVIGTDLPALCRELQREYPETRLLPFACGGFDTSFHQGVRETLLQLVKNLAARRGTEPPAFNIIGSCADLFRFRSDADELIRIMDGAFGMRPLCVLSSDTAPAQIGRMGGARLNLVIRREGEAAAEYLREQFGTPYLFERPYGTKATVQWIRKIGEITGTGPDEDFIAAQVREAETLSAQCRATLSHLLRQQPDALKLSLGGHADIVKGIMAFGCGELLFPRGLCWCDDPGMAGPDIPYFPEDELIGALEKQRDGLVMASGEILAWSGRSRALQISNPGPRWHINPYEPPFVAFRGALNLLDLWINEAMENTG